MTRCATVALVGRPNAGKSTLMNAILGMHLSIVTPKPQTTRKNILGIHTTESTQLVFIDTPGLLTPRYKLQRSMMGSVDQGLEQADIICVVVDATKASQRETILDPMWKRTLEREQKPAVLILNKMDILPNRSNALALMEEARLSGLFCKAIAISARNNTYVEDLLAILTEMSPEAPFAYGADEITDRPERFFVAEFIRETIFTQFKEEVPYATEVSITEFKEREGGKWYIAADILVERENQKAILIGAKGSALKAVGETARRVIEEHLGTPVYLELFVKVRNDWRNDRAQLESLGY